MSGNEELSSIFNRVSERHAIIKNLEEKRLFKFMRENSFLEVHSIELVANIKDPNVTKLSKALRVTRGAISKTVKKLIEDGVIEKYQRPENRKEIYYRLTDAGKAILQEHEQMHRTRIERDSFYFSPLSEEEKEELIRLLNKMYGQIAKQLKQMGMENII